MSDTDESARRAPSLFDGVPEALRSGGSGRESAQEPWPPYERFPLNEEGRQVEETISACYEASQTFTGVDPLPWTVNGFKP